MRLEGWTQKYVKLQYAQGHESNDTVINQLTLQTTLRQGHFNPEHKGPSSSAMQTGKSLRVNWSSSHNSTKRLDSKQLEQQIPKGKRWKIKCYLPARAHKIQGREGSSQTPTQGLSLKLPGQSRRPQNHPTSKITLKSPRSVRLVPDLRGSRQTSKPAHPIESDNKEKGHRRQSFKFLLM